MKSAAKFAIYAAAGVLALGVADARADITVVSWGGGLRREPAEGLWRDVGGQNRKESYLGKL